MGRSVALGLSLLLCTGCRAAAVLAPGPAAVSAPAAPSAVTEGVIDVGAGVSLHIHCVGDGAPVVVFEAGGGQDSRTWDAVLPDVGEITRACVYDRAGLGHSSRPASRPHTHRTMVRELHALLRRAGLRSPYVLVGHSMGGANVRLFASEHLDEVAGMVLVDSMGAAQPSRLWSQIPEPQMAEFRASLRKNPEGLDFDEGVASLADLDASCRPIGGRPLVALTAGRGDSTPGTSPEQRALLARTWLDMQNELARLSTNAVHVVAEKSGHFIQWEAPQLVVALVRQVVDASRTARPLDVDALNALARANPPGRP
jgi:pimeloyl-ACP methyl ester carboxylesterase